MSKSVRLSQADRRTIKTVRRATAALSGPEKASWTRSLNYQGRTVHTEKQEQYR